MYFLKSASLLSKLYKLGICIFLVFMFVFPSASLAGAKRGLLLWFNTVLPTLLPFIILSTLIVRLNIATVLCRFLHPIIGPLFRVTKNACYPIVIGFLTGIPMGAKTSADLVFERQITRHEGQFLAIMCNNASPMFVLGYIALSELNLPNLKLPFIGILYGSAILTAIFFRKFYRFFTHESYDTLVATTTNTTTVASKVYAQSTEISSIKKSRRFNIDFTIIDQAIMDGFDVVTKIGGYIILFSMLAQIILSIQGINSLLKMVIVGLCEITCGIDTIATSSLSNKLKIVLILAITSFGGFSGLAQTKSVFADSGLSIKSYMKAKMINALFTFLLAFLYVKLVF